MAALLCMFPSVLAQEDQAQLSMDFLEYLAEMEQVEGEWIDASDSSNLAANDSNMNPIQSLPQEKLSSSNEGNKNDEAESSDDRGGEQ